MNFNITNFSKSSLVDPKYIKPMRLNYTQNKKHKTWEAVKSFNSVSVLLYHTKKDAFLVVKQFRPAVYMTDKNFKYTYELCAGIIDKDIDLDLIVSEEIDEECGYMVPLENIQKITTFFANVGVSGSKQHIYFANIDETMKLHDGGGIDDEFIKLEFIKTKDAKKFIFDETKAKTSGLMFAFYWFLNEKKGEL